MGKPMSLALGDAEEARDISNYFSGLIELADGQTSLNSPDHLNVMVRQPFGVVAAIVPWNFPTSLVGRCIPVDDGNTDRTRALSRSGSCNWSR